MEAEVQPGEPAKRLPVCGGQASPGVHRHPERGQQPGDGVWTTRGECYSGALAYLEEQRILL